MRLSRSFQGWQIAEKVTEYSRSTPFVTSVRLPPIHYVDARGSAFPPILDWCCTKTKASGLKRARRTWYSLSLTHTPLFIRPRASIDPRESLLPIHPPCIHRTKSNYNCRTAIIAFRPIIPCLNCSADCMHARPGILP